MHLLLLTQACAVLCMAGRTRHQVLVRRPAIKHGGRCKALHRQSKDQKPDDYDLEEAGHGRQYSSKIKGQQSDSATWLAVRLPGSKQSVQALIANVETDQQD